MILNHSEARGHLVGLSSTAVQNLSPFGIPALDELVVGVK